jgi:hypothetical protein
MDDNTDRVLASASHGGAGRPEIQVRALGWLASVSCWIDCQRCLQVSDRAVHLCRDQELERHMLNQALVKSASEAVSMTMRLKCADSRVLLHLCFCKIDHTYSSRPARTSGSGTDEFSKGLCK